MCTKPPSGCMGHQQPHWEEWRFSHSQFGTYGCSGIRQAPATLDHSPAHRGRKTPHKAPHTPRGSLCASPHRQPLGGCRHPTEGCSVRAGGSLPLQWPHLAMSNHVQMLPSSHLLISAFTDCYVSFAFFARWPLLQMTLIPWLLFSLAGGHLSLWHNRFGANIP